MRVLMICPELPTASDPGSMAPAVRQFKSLRDAGIDVEVIDMRGPAKLKYLQLIPRVRRQAATADLIHAHFGYCGWLAKVQTTCPIVLSFMGSDVYGDTLAHGKPGIYSRSVAYVNRRFLSKSVAAIIVKSQQMADLLAPLRTTVIANGVDMRLFSPTSQASARSRLGWNETGQAYVLFPGDPSNPRKGFELANQVIHRLRNQIENVELKTLWDVPPDEVPVYLNACDAMLMASLAEGSPNVVKEAMACNTPVVASPVGDVSDLLANVSGSTVCNRDPDSMFDALMDLIQIGGRSTGRDKIFELQLDLKSVAQRIIAVYEAVLRSAPVDAVAN